MHSSDPDYIIASCDVCSLVDGDYRQKPCLYCGACNAYICDQCRPKTLRRALAMAKRSMRKWFLGTTVILLLVAGALGQKECGSLQNLPQLNSLDVLGIVHQNACWNPSLLQLTFPLGPAGGGTVTGSGTTNTVAMWTASTAIGNSPITVNGNLISLPATGSWQNYHGLTSIGNGMSQIVGIAQGSSFISNISPITILASVPASGHQFFRINCYLVVITAATTSGTLPQCQASWTDANTSVVETATFSPTGTNTVGAFVQGAIFINPSPGTAITVSSTGYASVGGTALTYVDGFNIESL